MERVLVHEDGPSWTRLDEDASPGLGVQKKRLSVPLRSPLRVEVDDERDKQRLAAGAVCVRAVARMPRAALNQLRVGVGVPLKAVAVHGCVGHKGRAAVPPMATASLSRAFAMRRRRTSLRLLVPVNSAWLLASCALCLLRCVVQRRGGWELRLLRRLSVLLVTEGGNVGHVGDDILRVQLGEPRLYLDDARGRTPLEPAQESRPHAPAEGQPRPVARGPLPEPARRLARQLVCRPMRSYAVASRVRACAHSTLLADTSDRLLI
eukprot:6204532-Pleurochrysis_carterae.AAC.1